MEYLVALVLVLVTVTTLVIWRARVVDRQREARRLDVELLRREQRRAQLYALAVARANGHPTMGTVCADEIELIQEFGYNWRQEFKQNTDSVGRTMGTAPIGFGGDA